MCGVWYVWNYGSFLYIFCHLAFNCKNRYEVTYTNLTDTYAVRVLYLKFELLLHTLVQNYPCVHGWTW